MANKQTERQTFFEECAESYPQALIAISEFANHVQEKCRRVMEKHIKVLAKIIAVELDSDSVSRYTIPNKIDKIPPKLDYVNLGVRAKRQGNLEVACALYWEPDGKPPKTDIGVLAYIWVNRAETNRKLFQELDLTFKKTPPNGSGWVLEAGAGSCPVLWRQLLPEKVKSFDEELDRLMQYLIVLLRGTKNVSRHFRSEQATADRAVAAPSDVE